jgi:broad-specificity NMP kinase
MDSLIIDEDKVCLCFVAVRAGGVEHALFVHGRFFSLALPTQPPHTSSLSPLSSQVVDALEDQLAAGGVVLDYHSCDFFPERWFDLVVVLTTDNSVLYERLAGRGYSPAKISANVECEIMRVCVDEAADAYAEDIVKVLASNTVEDMEANVEWVAGWATAVSAKAAAAAAAAGAASG